MLGEKKTNYDSTGTTKLEKQQLSTDSLKSSNKDEKKKGLSVLGAALFIAGEMAGSGVLALPKAVVDTGWIGLVLILVLCFNSWYASTRLGLCWEILEERWPQYRVANRNPYPTIAYRAVGKWGSILVSGCIQVTLFGAGLVYLLLASEIIQDLLAPVFPNITFCSWFLVIALLITPPMWLGSPKDFSWVGVGALVTIALACLLMFSQMVIDFGHSPERIPHKVHTFPEFFIAFGIIMFAFGGASIFPTIQNDMKDKTKFMESATIAFIVVMSLYFPVAVTGYLAYGERVTANVILSFTDSPLVTVSNILMAIHLVFAFLIAVNPVSQELEVMFNVPSEFGLRRCLVRSLLVFTMVLVGESVPQFSKILSLVGGSTVALATFILPNYFYMRLASQKNPSWPERKVPLYQKVYMWELIVIGLLGGAIATYSSVQSIFGMRGSIHSCFARLF